MTFAIRRRLTRLTARGMAGLAKTTRATRSRIGNYDALGEWLPVLSPISLAPENRDAYHPTAPHPAVIVTGASEGIGRAFAELLHAEGFSVVLIARDGARLATLADRLADREIGPRAFPLALDVALADSQDRIEAFLAERGLYADIVINNAGVGLGGRFDTLDAAQLLQLLRVNVEAVVRITHKFLPGMRERGRGGVLNLASMAGFMPGPWQSVYHASKAFVLSFSQSLATECAGTGVRIMAAAPGPVETRLHFAMRAQHSFYRRTYPSHQPAEAARLLWEAFSSRRRVFTAGIVNNLSIVGARLLPEEMLTPLIGWLVRPRLPGGKALP